MATSLQVKQYDQIWIYTSVLKGEIIPKEAICIGSKSMPQVICLKWRVAKNLTSVHVRATAAITIPHGDNCNR